MNKKPKPKKCKVCKTPFQQQRPLQYLCSPKCAIEDAKKKVEKKAKKQQTEQTKEAKKSLLKQADYVQILQKVFNTYIRMRDEEQPCISCGTTKENIKYDAGHFYHAGNYPHLRFNENNVHKQCSYNCNMNMSGNVHEYALRLPNRIGKQAFEELKELAHKFKPQKLSIPEIEEKIIYYKNLIKIIKKSEKL